MCKNSSDIQRTLQSRTTSISNDQDREIIKSRSQHAAMVALLAAEFASRKMILLNKSIQAWSKSSKMDLRRRTTKKRLLVTLFAEALEVSAARSNNEDAKSEENWGTIDGVQLRKVVTASFVSMFFPKHAKAIES